MYKSFGFASDVLFLHPPTTGGDAPAEWVPAATVGVPQLVRSSPVTTVRAAPDTSAPLFCVGIVTSNNRENLHPVPVGFVPGSHFASCTQGVTAATTNGKFGTMDACVPPTTTADTMRFSVHKTPEGGGSNPESSVSLIPRLNKLGKMAFRSAVTTRHLNDKFATGNLGPVLASRQKDYKALETADAITPGTVLFFMPGTQLVCESVPNETYGIDVFGVYPETSKMVQYIQSKGNLHPELTRHLSPGANAAALMAPLPQLVTIPIDLSKAEDGISKYELCKSAQQAFVFDGVTAGESVAKEINCYIPEGAATVPVAPCSPDLPLADTMGVTVKDPSKLAEKQSFVLLLNVLASCFIFKDKENVFGATPPGHTKRHPFLYHRGLTPEGVSNVCLVPFGSVYVPAKRGAEIPRFYSPRNSSGGGGEVETDKHKAPPSSQEPTTNSQAVEPPLATSVPLSSRVFTDGAVSDPKRAQEIQEDKGQALIVAEEIKHATAVGKKIAARNVGASSPPLVAVPAPAPSTTVKESAPAVQVVVQEQGQEEKVEEENEEMAEEEEEENSEVIVVANTYQKVKENTAEPGIHVSASASGGGGGGKRSAKIPAVDSMSDWNNSAWDDRIPSIETSKPVMPPLSEAAKKTMAQWMSVPVTKRFIVTQISRCLPALQRCWPIDCAEIVTTALLGQQHHWPNEVNIDNISRYSNFKWEKWVLTEKGQEGLQEALRVMLWEHSPAPVRRALWLHIFCGFGFPDPVQSPGALPSLPPPDAAAATTTGGKGTGKSTAANSHRPSIISNGTAVPPKASTTNEGAGGTDGTVHGKGGRPRQGKLSDVLMDFYAEIPDKRTFKGRFSNPDRGIKANTNLAVDIVRAFAGANCPVKMLGETKCYQLTGAFHEKNPDEPCSQLEQFVTDHIDIMDEATGRPVPILELPPHVSPVFNTKVIDGVCCLPDDKIEVLVPFHINEVFTSGVVKFAEIKARMCAEARELFEKIKNNQVTAPAIVPKTAAVKRALPAANKPGPKPKRARKSSAATEESDTGESFTGGKSGSDDDDFDRE